MICYTLHYMHCCTILHYTIPYCAGQLYYATYTMLYYTILYYTILCYNTMLYYATICYIYTILCYTYYAILCYNMLYIYYTILYYATISYIYTILYYAIYAMLYYTIFCYTILYHTVQGNREDGADGSREEQQSRMRKLTRNTPHTGQDPALLFEHSHFV